MGIVAFLCGALVGGLLSLLAVAGWLEKMFDDNDNDEYDDR